MFHRLKLFVQAIKTAHAVRKGGDFDVEVEKLMRRTGLKEARHLTNFSLDATAEDLLLNPPVEKLLPRDPQLTPDHVKLIRQMRLSWNGVENGAPQCEPTRSFTDGKAPKLVRNMLGDVSDEEVVEFMISLLPAIGVFMREATLVPGTYTLRNMDTNQLASTIQGIEATYSPFQINDDFTIILTEEDIRLCKSATWEMADEDEMYSALEHGDIAGPTVNPKRPYGEMSNIILDIHQILEWPVEHRGANGQREISEAQSTLARELHFRQLGTMQAFLECANCDGYMDTQNLGSGNETIRNRPPPKVSG